MTSGRGAGRLGERLWGLSPFRHSSCMIAASLMREPTGNARSCTSVCWTRPMASTVLCVALAVACGHVHSSAAKVSEPSRSTRAVGFAGSAPEPEPFRAFPCAEGLASDDKLTETEYRARSMSLAVDVSYFVLRRAFPELSDTLAERGRACGEIADTRACMSTLNQFEMQLLASGRSCDEETCPSFVYALTTHANEVVMWRDPAQLLQLFGALDTPTEAWFWLMATRAIAPYKCNDPEVSAQRSTATGYQLRVRTATHRCRPLEFADVVYQVDLDGSVRELGRSVVSSEPDQCAPAGKPETPAVHDTVKCCAQ
jgi:hypothetical protein